MIRRIILFLGLLFVGFFVYRRYDKTAADTLLYKIKNLSFSKSASYTTTIYDPTGSGKIISSSGLLDKISDTLSDKTATGSAQTNDQIIQSILQEDKLQQGVTVPGMSGTVIVQTGPIETISAQPIVTHSSSSSSKKPAQTTSQPTLSQEDKQQLEEFSSFISQ